MVYKVLNKKNGAGVCICAWHFDIILPFIPWNTFVSETTEWLFKVMKNMIDGNLYIIYLMFIRKVAVSQRGTGKSIRNLNLWIYEIWARFLYMNFSNKNNGKVHMKIVRK